jgi:hypothetical protein
MVDHVHSACTAILGDTTSATRVDLTTKERRIVVVNGDTAAATAATTTYCGVLHGRCEASRRLQETEATDIVGRDTKRTTRTATTPRDANGTGVAVGGHHAFNAKPFGDIQGENAATVATMTDNGSRTTGTTRAKLIGEQEGAIGL